MTSPMSYKLVPVEPTQEMVDAMGNQIDETEIWASIRDAYVAVLSASPKVQIDDGMVDRALNAYYPDWHCDSADAYKANMRRALLAALTPEQEG